MNKFAIVFCPYFGKLPHYFNLWLISASYNSDISFVILTNDKKKYNLPSNVRIIHMDLEELKSIIQRNFDFSISLEDAYKLCDYKPTYGYCLKELVDFSDYLFWGFCDLDIIWGNLNNFLPNNYEQYAKISYAGHFSLFKNDDRINEAFMIMVDKVNYTTILSNSAHFAFDEIGNYSINSILETMGEKIFHYEEYVARISPLSSNLDVGTSYDPINNKTIQYDKRKKVFSFEEGRIFDYSIGNNGVEKREWAYIHLQKRMMNLCNIENTSRFMIMPHSFEEYFVPTIVNISKVQERKLYPHYFHVKYNAGKRKIARIKAINSIRR